VSVSGVLLTRPRTFHAPPTVRLLFGNVASLAYEVLVAMSLKSAGSRLAFPGRPRASVSHMSTLVTFAKVPCGTSREAFILTPGLTWLLEEFRALGLGVMQGYLVHKEQQPPLGSP